MRRVARIIAPTLALVAVSCLAILAVIGLTRDVLPAGAQEWEAGNMGQERTADVARGEVVTVRNLNGTVTALPTGGSQSVIRARKVADRDNPDDVRVEVIEDSEGVLICAVYPAPSGREPNRCSRGDGYRMNVRNNDVKVHFTLEIPSGVRFEARTVNGDIDAEGLSEEVSAKTVNGDIVIADNEGEVSAETVNGSIEAQMMSRPAEDISFKTTNGGIRVVLPDDTDADVEIRTVNGSINTDFPLRIRGRWGPRSASGEIGSGGPEIELRTVNGSIALTRGN